MWVVATPLGGTTGPLQSPIHNLGNYTWLSLGPQGLLLGPGMDVRPPDGGWFQVQIYPVSVPMAGAAPVPISGNWWEACQPLLEAAEGRRRRDGYSQSNLFISFNDAQWTTADQGYSLARTRTGVTFYVDQTSADPLGEDPLLKRVKGFFKLTGTSRWYVMIGRTKDDIERILEEITSKLR